jgi:hypothetical protein
VIMQIRIDTLQHDATIECDRPFHDLHHISFHCNMIQQSVTGSMEDDFVTLKTAGVAIIVSHSCGIKC